ncbi:MAG: penicillin-insensitive murein endopeptidase [Aliidongia sp.]
MRTSRSIRRGSARLRSSCCSSAAADERVERIFVNPAIKLALCRGYGGATAGGTAWLHRLRPGGVMTITPCPPCAARPIRHPARTRSRSSRAMAATPIWPIGADRPRPAVVPPRPAPPAPPRKAPAACLAVLKGR